jgi:GT2 family glycosyltransferase
MTSAAYKFGGFLFYVLPDAGEAVNGTLQTETSFPAISNLSAFIKKTPARWLLAVSAEKEIRLPGETVRRLVQSACDTLAGIVYSDYFIEQEGSLSYRSLLDYQEGSIRDDFHFGDVLLISLTAAGSVLQKYGRLPADEHCALYDLRLKISVEHPIIHMPEALYTVAEKKKKQNGKRRAVAEPHFAYTAAKNQSCQKMLEKAATNYLKLIGAHLKVRTKKPAADKVHYPVTASVIIPVLNRKKTIADALQSALAQKTNFDFNIIVVDNHSTDGTTEIIKKLAARHPQIQHLIPARLDLSIGGCWNEAIYSPCCGRYAVQLDSDDLYSSSRTLQNIIDVFKEGNYAMIIGSYTIVNERLKKIAPGLIDHREWTKANGHNNALRVGGLGAPRAFNTAILRRIGFPNVGYGEDYAVALRITREYEIGRIYDSLYLCRRWSDNTDAALSVEKQNRNDYYKDKLRTLEIAARKQLNKKAS